MSDTDQGHSNLRGPDDTVVDDPQPTLTDPGVTTTTTQVVDPFANLAHSITPGTIEHATEVDNSGQAPPEAAQEWVEPQS